MKPEDRFIIYTICVGLTTLQATKVIFDVRFMDAIRKLRLRRQQIDLAMPVDPADDYRLPPINPPTNPQPTAPAENAGSDDASNNNQSSSNNPTQGPSASTPSGTEDTAKKPDTCNSQPETPDTNQNLPDKDKTISGNQDLDLALKSNDNNSVISNSFSKNPENRSYIVELEE